MFGEPILLTREVLGKLIQEGIDSGPAEEMIDEKWDELWAEVARCTYKRGEENADENGNG